MSRSSPLSCFPCLSWLIPLLFPFVLFVTSVVKTSFSPIQAPVRNAHASRYGRAATSLFILHNSYFIPLTSLPLPFAPFMEQHLPPHTWHEAMNTGAFQSIRSSHQLSVQGAYSDSSILKLQATAWRGVCISGGTCTKYSLNTSSVPGSGVLLSNRTRTTNSSP